MLLLLACASSPDAWTLTSGDLRVTVTASPYTVAVAGPDGTVLTTADRTGDGYAPAAFAGGSTSWDSIVSPGWFDFTTNLDPYTQDWEVVDEVDTPTSLTLTLAPPDGGDARMTLVHTVSAGRLRVEGSVTGDAPRAWSVGFTSPADEAFLGFGERFNRTNQRGVAVYQWAEEGGIGTGEGNVAGPDNPYPNGEAMSYYPVPFFVSTAGYGFWLDTDYRSQFELGTEDDGAWRAWSIAPTLAYEVYVAAADDPRPWPYQVMDTFTAQVGRPMVPPDWAFGPRRRIGDGSTVDGVSEIQVMRDQDLALTVVDDSVHFLPEGSHVGIEDELRAWTESAHALGYKALCYYNAHLADSDDNPLQDELATGHENGWFVKDEAGVETDVGLISGSPLSVLTVDLTDPDARTWYGELLQWAVDLGYSGWMYDFGEYIQPDDLAADGTPGEAWHNRFPRDYQSAAHEAMQASPIANDWLLFARSGTTGASQYVPVVWSGDPAASFEDSDGLPSMVRGALNMGISGVPNWGSDIGGFHCIADGSAAADDELLARWIEFGATTSDMHDENACSANADGGDKATIWTAPNAYTAWATYARLHTRLFPYLYALSKEAHTTGAPIDRQLFLDHPDQPALADVDDAYDLGPALYVAPVLTRGATTRDVVVADSEVLDWRDGTVYPQGTVTVSAPLTELPLFLRPGGLVPLLDASIDTLAPEFRTDVVGQEDVADVYDVVGFFPAGATGSFTLAEGATLSATWSGGLDLGALTAVDDVADCTGCWSSEVLPSGVTRVHVAVTGDVDAGGLHLRSTSTRRLRWDLYLGA